MDEPRVAGVAISRPDKVLEPASGLTKLGLATYYAEVAPVLLPHLRGRPTSLERFPDGTEGGSFYAKQVPSHFPDWVRRVRVASSTRETGWQDQVVVADVRTLALLAQQACLTVHTWLCTERDLDRPDQLVLDLDPQTDDVSRVRRATRLVGELLNDLGLTSYVKTTGSRGYHVLVPLRRDGGFEEVRGLARGIGAHLAAREPDLFTVEQRKADRGTRVLVDYWRNGYGQTIVPPYAVRARPGAPVSTPITWDELDEVAPAGVTVATLAERLAAHGDPWRGLRRDAQGLGRARRRLASLTG